MEVIDTFSVGIGKIENALIFDSGLGKYACTGGGVLQRFMIGSTLDAFHDPLISFLQPVFDPESLIDS